MAVTANFNNSDKTKFELITWVYKLLSASPDKLGLYVKYI